MCDTENLITAVEKYPSLWNVSHESFHDRDLKDLAWEQICLELFEDWESKNDQEKKKICADTKKKWNNVRDCFRRDVNKIKNTPTGSGTKKQKQYVYSDLLTFLTPNMQSRRHEGNYDNGGEGPSTDGTRQDEEEDTNSNVEDNITEKVPEKRKTANKDIPSQIFEMMKQGKQEPVADDDDTKFLLSFRSDLKTMTKSQKIDFKIGMLQLVKKITVHPRNVYEYNTTGLVPVPLYPQQSPLSPPEHSQHSLSGHADSAVVYEFLQFKNNI